MAPGIVMNVLTKLAIRSDLLARQLFFDNQFFRLKRFRYLAHEFDACHYGFEILAVSIATLFEISEVNLRGILGICRTQPHGP